VGPFLGGGVGFLGAPPKKTTHPTPIRTLMVNLYGWTQLHVQELVRPYLR
jgi:hypothetical protein